MGHAESHAIQGWMMTVLAFVTISSGYGEREIAAQRTQYELNIRESKGSGVTPLEYLALELQPLFFSVFWGTHTWLTPGDAHRRIQGTLGGW